MMKKITDKLNSSSINLQAIITVRVATDLIKKMQTEVSTDLCWWNSIQLNRKHVKNILIEENKATMKKKQEHAMNVTNWAISQRIVAVKCNNNST